MIYVGIDIAKDKHDCFIINSDGEILFNPFSSAISDAAWITAAFVTRITILLTVCSPSF